MRLKPCPFCYSTEAKISILPDFPGVDTGRQVVCSKCGTSGPHFAHREHGAMWAVQAWNQLARTVDWPKEEEPS